MLVQIAGLGERLCRTAAGFAQDELCWNRDLVGQRAGMRIPAERQYRIPCENHTEGTAQLVQLSDDCSE